MILRGTKKEREGGKERDQADKKEKKNILQPL